MIQIGFNCDSPVILPFLTDTKSRRVKQPLTVAYHRLLYVAVRYCKTITTLLHSLEPHLKFQKYIYLTNYSGHLQPSLRRGRVIPLDTALSWAKKGSMINHAPFFIF